MQPTPQISGRHQSAPEASVWIKRENHTPIEHSARTAIVYAEELFKHSSGIKGLIMATRGNHGQTVTFAGQRFNIPVTIVVPHGTAEKNTAMCDRRPLMAGDDTAARDTHNNSPKSNTCRWFPTTATS
jgi:threonine dehydratase